MKPFKRVQLAGAILMLVGASLLGPPQAHAANCADLLGSSITITANGYEAEMVIQSGNLPSISGTIAFTGEPVDNFTGTCSGRHIVFTRTRPNDFTQVYDGWISTKQGTQQLAGSFSHDASPQKYPWCGTWIEFAK